MTTTKRGFATFTPEQRKAIAVAGGKAAQATGKAHRFTHDEAKIAGAKGAQTVMAKHGIEHMRAIGTKGGNAMRKRRAEKAPDVERDEPSDSA